jgi:endo-1,3-1,4-beta-glycanase ExoK
MRHSPAIALGIGISALVGAAAAATTLNGAEFYSNETVKYGRWEIRMQVAATPGSVSSFFTYYNNSSSGGSEPWREIDIEILGKNGNGFQSNLITGSAASRTTSEAFHAAPDLSKGFHTYVLDWTPDSIVYRVDGVSVRKDLGSMQQVRDLSDKVESYRLNIWASTNSGWVGALDPEKLPVIQTVNWIAYSSYTPGQGPNRSDFTPKWIDEFNNLDTQRWARANWTFDGNMADFTPNNAVVSGGYLMLILSKKGWSGNPTPPSDPQGNTRPPVALVPGRGSDPFRIRGLQGALQEAGDRAGEVSILSLDGRVLAHGEGPGRLRFDGKGQQAVVVRSREGALIAPAR